MSTPAIPPISSITFASSSATGSQQSVFNELLDQLEQALTKGDLSTSETLMNALNSLSPGSQGTSAVNSFLTSVGSAIQSGSVSQAQSVLATYLSAARTSATSGGGAAASPGTSATATTIASGLVQSQIQLSMVTSLLAASTSQANGVIASGGSSSGNSINSMMGILNAAFGSADSSTSSASPYDVLVASIQTQLSAGSNVAGTALSYLESSGNLVNTVA
jgi:hypothetical protein